MITHFFDDESHRHQTPDILPFLHQQNPPPCGQTAAPHLHSARVHPERATAC
jgi:hypothetical protein